MKTTLLILWLSLALACDQPERAPATAADTTATRDSTSPPAGASPTEDAVVTAWLERVDPAVFMRWGACPFECCVYRDWVADSQVVVRAQPDSAAAVVATIPAGGRFEADTGFVRVTSAQLVIVTDTVEAYRVTGRPDGGSPDSLAPGDTVLVLDYQGEGHYLLTDGTATYSAGQFWPGADDWQPYGGAKGTTLGRHAAQWWAHVTTSDGTEGWIDAYASDLGNVDACGVPT